MHHPLTVHLLPRVFGIGVNQVPVAREGGEVHHVGFGHGAAQAFHRIAHGEVLEPEGRGLLQHPRLHKEIHTD